MPENQPTQNTGIVIPPELLSEEALHGLIEEFILREGTDYGRSEFTLDQKFIQVMNQLRGGHVLIFFSPEDETTTLLRKEQVPKTLHP